MALPLLFCGFCFGSLPLVVYLAYAGTFRGVDPLTPGGYRKVAAATARALQTGEWAIKAHQL